MGQLKIIFRGICTHFHSATSSGLAGIPHRVVLVDGTSTRFGTVDVPVLGTQTYHIMPHMPKLTCAGVSFREIAPDLFDEFDQLVVRSVLTIPNTVDPSVIYPPPPAQPDSDPSFIQHVPPVANFATPGDYFYSSDVVLGGNAAVYLDLAGGEIRAEMVGSEILVTATVHTPEGQVPILRIAPFDHHEAIPISLHDGAELTINNAGVGCSVGNPAICQWDFLLHLITNRRGIPTDLGPLSVIELGGNPNPGETIANAIQILAGAIKENLQPGDWPLKAIVGNPPNDSCSDSRYP
jgi:hypothetical protein